MNIQDAQSIPLPLTPPRFIPATLLTSGGRIPGTSRTSDGLRFGVLGNTPPNSITTIAVDAMGVHVAAIDISGAVFVFDIPAGQYFFVGSFGVRASTALWIQSSSASASHAKENTTTISLPSSKLLLGLADGSLRIIDVVTGNVSASLIPSHKTATCTLLQADSSNVDEQYFLLSVSPETAVIWTPTTTTTTTKTLSDQNNGWTRRRALGPTSTSGVIVAAALASGTGTVAIAFADDGILVWDGFTFEKIARLSLPPEEVGAKLTCLDISEDGSMVVAGAANGCIYVWDVAAATTIRIIDLPSPRAGLVQVAAVHPSVAARLRARAEAAGRKISPSVSLDAAASIMAAPQLVALDSAGNLLIVDLQPTQPAAVYELQQPLGENDGRITGFSLASNAASLGLKTASGGIAFIDLPLAVLRYLETAAPTKISVPIPKKVEEEKLVSLPLTENEIAHIDAGIQVNILDTISEHDVGTNTEEETPIKEKNIDRQTNQEIMQQLSSSTSSTKLQLGLPSSPEELVTHEIHDESTYEESIDTGLLSPKSPTLSERRAEAVALRLSENKYATENENKLLFSTSKEEEKKYPMLANTDTISTRTEKESLLSSPKDVLTDINKQASTIENNDNVSSWIRAPDLVISTSFPHVPAPLQSLLIDALESPTAARDTARRIRLAIQTTGQLPTRYRPVAWRLLLRLPTQAEAFTTLVRKALFPGKDGGVWADIHIRFPLRDSIALARLRRLCGALSLVITPLARYSSLPSLVFPFAHYFATCPHTAQTPPVFVQNNVPLHELYAFETILTIVCNWARGWIATAPHPPLLELSHISSILRWIDIPLATHLDACGLGAGNLVWPMLKSVFAEILPRVDWETLWDVLFAYAHEPSMIHLAAVAILRYIRNDLLAIPVGKDAPTKLISCVRTQLTVHIPAVIKFIFEMRKKIPSHLYTLCEDTILDDGPLYTLPQGVAYPVPIPPDELAARLVIINGNTVVQDTALREDEIKQRKQQMTMEAVREDNIKKNTIASIEYDQALNAKALTEIAQVRQATAHERHLLATQLAKERVKSTFNKSTAVKKAEERALAIKKAKEASLNALKNQSTLIEALEENIAVQKARSFLQEKKNINTTNEESLNESFNTHSTNKTFEQEEKELEELRKSREKALQKEELTRKILANVSTSASVNNTDIFLPSMSTQSNLGPSATRLVESVQELAKRTAAYHNETLSASLNQSVQSTSSLHRKNDVVSPSNVIYHTNIDEKKSEGNRTLSEEEENDTNISYDLDNDFEENEENDEEMNTNFERDNDNDKDTNNPNLAYDNESQENVDDHKHTLEEMIATSINESVASERIPLIPKISVDSLSIPASVPASVSLTSSARKAQHPEPSSYSVDNDILSSTTMVSAVPLLNPIVKTEVSNITNDTLINTNKNHTLSNMLSSPLPIINGLRFGSIAEGSNGYSVPTPSIGSRNVTLAPILSTNEFSNSVIAGTQPSPSIRRIQPRPLPVSIRQAAAATSAQESLIRNNKSDTDTGINTSNLQQVYEDIDQEDDVNEDDDSYEVAKNRVNDGSNALKNIMFGNYAKANDLTQDYLDDIDNEDDNDDYVFAINPNAINENNIYLNTSNRSQV